MLNSQDGRGTMVFRYVPIAACDIGVTFVREYKDELRRGLDRCAGEDDRAVLALAAEWRR